MSLDNVPLFTGGGEPADLGGLVDEDGPRDITLTCPDCSHTVTGPDRGKGSAHWRLGTHRANKHGYRAGGKPARAAKGAPTEDELAAQPILGGVKAVAAAVGSRKGAPSGTDLAKGLGQGLSLLTITAATYAAETDPGIPDGPDGEQQRDMLIDYLVLPPQAAQDVMAPIGRAFAPTKLNQKYGRQVVENVDVLGSVAELGTLLMHWRRYMRLRMQPAAAAAPALSLVPAGGSTPPPAGTVITPTLDQPQPRPQVTTPPPQTGRVITAADVAAAQRGNPNR